MPQLELLLPAIVFIPFAAAVLALWLGRFAGQRTGILMVLAAAASFLGCLQVVTAGASLGFTREWIPGINVALSFRGDPYGCFFALLISGIGTLVGIYSLSYLPALAPARVSRYYAALLAFMGAMLGVALADDLILLFIFWEVTSLTSFLLIGFWYEQETARKGALTALLVTALGGLTMMIGFIIVGTTTGSFSLRALTEQAALRDRLAGSPLFLAALLLIVLGAMTKSAQWPFHFWLPGAMVAPTPVSTYLHAATMVWAGVFLLGRFLPIFGTSPAWAGILVPIGLATFLLGAVEAFLDTDLKGILAKTTVATLGLVTMLYGLGAAGQDALQMFSHAMYKGALFLVVGIVEHATHTRDIRDLGGLRHKMPVTFFLCILGALSLAGIWPTFGFLAKEALYAQLLAGTPLSGWVPSWLLLALTVLANALLFAVACRLVFGVFFGAPTEAARHSHEVGPGLWLSPMILAGLSLGLGLLAPATSAIVSHFSSGPGTRLTLTLAPDHLGPLLLSIGTFLLGFGIYRGRAVLGRMRSRAPGAPTMQALWDKGMDAVTTAAIGFSVRWQSGSLRWYLAGSLAFTVGLSAPGVAAGGDLGPPGADQPAGDDLVRPDPLRDAGLHGGDGGPLDHAGGGGHRAHLQRVPDGAALRGVPVAGYPAHPDPDRDRLDHLPAPDLVLHARLPAGGPPAHAAIRQRGRVGGRGRLDVQLRHALHQSPIPGAEEPGHRLPDPLHGAGRRRECGQRHHRGLPGH